MRTIELPDDPNEAVMALVQEALRLAPAAGVYLEVKIRATKPPKPIRRATGPRP